LRIYPQCGLGRFRGDRDSRGLPPRRVRGRRGNHGDRGRRGCGVGGAVAGWVEGWRVAWRGVLGARVDVASTRVGAAPLAALRRLGDC
jgi:hypothetical protein